MAVAVLGQGSVGRAAADRLAAAGHRVHAGDRHDRAPVLAAGADLLLLALTRGEECAAQLDECAALRRAAAVTVVVVANELSHGRSPVPDFSRLVDAHHAAERNPWPLWLRHRMVVEALLTPMAAAHRAALDAVAEVATAADVTELTEPDRLRCRVVVLRSGPALTKTQLDLLPALTDVIRSGSGTDNIDVPKLAARGITLHRRPDVAADAVAELALTGLVALCRRIGPGYRWLLDGGYAKQLLTGEPLAAQTLAVWGAGPVGRAVLRQARQHGFTRGCNVLLTQHQGAQRADVRAVLDSWSVDATVRILATDPALG